ncbi:junctional adhesion molecule B-like [Arapaima gigas]
MKIKGSRIEGEGDTTIWRWEEMESLELKEETHTQTVEKDTPRETQRACRNPHSDTYASLDVKSISPEYDTLTGVKRAAKHTELHTSAEPEGTYSCLDFCEEGRRAGGQMNRKKL